MREFEFLEKLEKALDTDLDNDIESDYDEGYEAGIEFARNLFMTVFEVSEVPNED